MNIRYLYEHDNRIGIQETNYGDSHAYYMPTICNKFTVLLSQIENGSATLQYSLSLDYFVRKNTANWHDWSLGEKDKDTGIVFDSPVRFIRVVCSKDDVGSKDEVRYTLEILG